MVTNEMKQDIKNSPTCSIISDESDDVSKMSQLCIVLRFFCRTGKIVERIAAFRDVSTGKDAESLCNVLFEVPHFEIPIFFINLE